MNDLILYMMQLPGTGEMRHLSECLNIYTKVFQHVFAVGGNAIKDSLETSLLSEGKERKENREPGNMEVQMIKEHILITLLQVQEEEEESLMSLSN